MVWRSGWAATSGAACGGRVCVRWRGRRGGGPAAESAGGRSSHADASRRAAQGRCASHLPAEAAPQAVELQRPGAHAGVRHQRQPAPAGAVRQHARHLAAQAVTLRGPHPLLHEGCQCSAVLFGLGGRVGQRRGGKGRGDDRRRRSQWAVAAAGMWLKGDIGCCDLTQNIMKGSSRLTRRSWQRHRRHGH